MMQPEIQERPTADIILTEYVPSDNVLEIRRQKFIIKMYEKQIEDYEKMIEYQKKTEDNKRRYSM